MAGELDKPDASVAETIFLGALALPAAERGVYLNARCGDNSLLRKRVEALLKAAQAPGGFLPEEHGTAPAMSPVTLTSRTLSVTEKAGDFIGRYKLLQKIGEGGCGVVYMAEQEEPVRRHVALKIIKLGMDTEQVVARFEAERQALALMDHANIAKVFDAGATESGRPYFVMELVVGTRITEYCDGHNLTTRQRLDVFIQVCRAVQHAHQKGIIHRDLKPSNVLVAEQDGIAVPKVIDFGIAKATQGRLIDQTVFTAFEQFLGTPAYMSPEQAQLGGFDVDTRSDIYSLGVLLYELLTGTTPFDTKALLAAGLDAMRRAILDKEPLTPSTRLAQDLAAADKKGLKSAATLKPASEHSFRASPRGLIQVKEAIASLRGDLDRIVMKCLEKDRAHRYETANGLARDIERYLNHEAVTASPSSNLYRFQKFVRRNKLAFTAASAVLIALVLGVAASTWQAIRATQAEREQSRLLQKAERSEANETRERKEAQSEAAKSKEVARFLKDMLRGVSPAVAQGRDTLMLREILDRTAERVGKQLTNQPEVELALRDTLASTYGDLGLYKQMEEQAQRALLLAKTRSAENREVAIALGRIGEARLRLGDLVQAEALARQVLNMRRKYLGPEHPDIATALNDLAVTLTDAGKWGEAETFAQEAVAMMRKTSKTDQQGFVSPLANLAYILEQRGRLDEAEPMLREALNMQRRLFGDDDPGNVGFLVNFAEFLRRRNKLEEAESTCRDALALARKLYGAEHPMLVVTRNNLASVLLARDKLEEAELLTREALDMGRKLLGPDHSAIAVALDNLGAVLMAQKKPAAAERVVRDALAMTQRLYGTNNEHVALSLNNLAWLLCGQKRYPEAELLIRESLEISRRSLPAAHRAVANAWNNLGVALGKQGKLAEAELALREALAIYEQLSASPEKIEMLGHLAMALQQQNKLPEAEASLRSALEQMSSVQQEPATESAAFNRHLYKLADVLRRERSFVEARSLAQAAFQAYRRHPQWSRNERQDASEVLLAVLRDMSDHAELERLYRASVDSKRHSLPADDPLLASNLAELAWSLFRQNKLIEAESLACESLLIREKNLPGDWHTFESGALLGTILLAQNKYAEAEPLLRSGSEGLKQRAAFISTRGVTRLKETFQHVARLYRVQGQPEQATRWQLVLEEFTSELFPEGPDEIPIPRNAPQE